MTRKLLLAVLTTGIVLGLGACNTVRGAGKDLNSAADSVDRAI